MPCMLLIHQDPVQVCLLAMLLELESVEPVICHGLEQAMDVYHARDDIDGVILDLQTLKAGQSPFVERSHGSRYYSMPIGGVSSQYDDCDAEQICTEFHLDGYLSLPVKPQRFRQFIQTLLQENMVSTPALTIPSCSLDKNCTTLGNR
ncbi:hypothetical protein [Nitrospira sp. M1]